MRIWEARNVEITGLCRFWKARGPWSRCAGTWTRFHLALTRNNRDCDPTDPRAVRFCAYGALVRSAYDLTGDVEKANRLAGSVAMSLTGRDTPTRRSRTSIR